MEWGHAKRNQGFLKRHTLIYKKIQCNQTKPSAVWQTQQATDSHWGSSFHKKILSMWSPPRNHSEMKWLATLRDASGQPLPKWAPWTDCDWQKSVGRERNSGTTSPQAQKRETTCRFWIPQRFTEENSCFGEGFKFRCSPCHHSKFKTQLVKKFRMKSIEGTWRKV